MMSSIASKRASTRLRRRDPSRQRRDDGWAVGVTAGPYWWDPEDVTLPWPAGPAHARLGLYVPAIDTPLVASYRPATSVFLTSMPPSIGVPAIDIVALPLTVPTSTSAPPHADRNSTTNVSLP